MKAFLEKLKAARRDPRDFLSPAITAPTGEEEWNVLILRDFWQVISDPMNCGFDGFYLDAIHAVLQQLDKEPLTPSRIVYLKNKQRQPLIFDSNKPLFGIPLWLHSVGTATELILQDNKERAAEAAKFGTKLDGRKIAGSTLAVKVITGLAHDLGKQDSILNMKIRLNDLSVNGLPFISKRQHALYSSQVFLSLMEKGNCLSSQEAVRERIKVAIQAHHEAVEILPRVVEIQNANALDITDSLIEADSKSRAIESCRPRIVWPEYRKKTRKKDQRAGVEGDRAL